MKSSFLLVVFFITSHIVFTQELPLDRLSNWSMVGTKIDLPLNTSNTIINFAEFSVDYDNLDFAISSALFQLSEGGTVYFPTGEYTFTQTIQVPDNVSIRGESSCETTLIFDLENGGNAFNIGGTQGAEYSLLSETANRKSNGVYVEDVEQFSIGDWVKISLDDSELVTSNWALNSIGQIAQIVNIQENLIIFDAELRLDYRLENASYIRKIIPRQGVHISSLKVIRADETSTQTSNFRFSYSVNCMIENVESERCNFSHIAVFNSAHLSIKNNYFHKAHSYGGGGRAYGVSLQFLTSECLIENNVFDSLRHSMLLQAGANGNVLAYNYSTNPYWTGTSLPTNAAGDLVLHGNYVFANLMEGNVIKNMVIDDSHGKNGPGNTFLRNRIEGFGLFMNSGVVTDSVNFIGNETIGIIGLWNIHGTGHYQYANNVLGEITPFTEVTTFNNSLYTSDIPSYFTETNNSFPPIGFPNIPLQNSLPAEVRYLNEQSVSDCTILSNTEIVAAEEQDFRIFPNPTNGLLFWEALGENIALNIVNLSGNRLLTYPISGTEGNLILRNLPSGFYLVELVKKDGSKTHKSLIISR